MTNPLGNTGPRAGQGSGRFRDTLANNASKRAYPNGYQAPVSSASAVGYGDQLAGARYQYLSQLAALKAQRPLIGQQYGLAVTDARTGAVANMAATEANALERGVTSSSSDLQARAGVIAARQRAIADAEAQRATARLGLAQQAMGLRGEYYNSVSSIQNAMAQEQMANTIMAFQNDSFDAMSQNYQDVLAAIRDAKYGNAPRNRRGVPARYRNDGWRTADEMPGGYYG
jgi:hypothetical protein